MTEAEDRPSECEKRRKDSSAAAPERRFPCGTQGFGIMTEYFGAGFGGSRGEEGEARAEEASRSGDGRFREVTARDDVAVASRRRLLDAGPQGRGEPAERLGASPRAAQERYEAGGAAAVRVPHLPAVHSDRPRPAP